MNAIDCELSCVVSVLLRLFFDKSGHNGRSGLMLPSEEDESGLKTKMIVDVL